MTNSLFKSLVDTLADSPLSDLGADFAEVSIDSILDDGVLKEIPVVKGIVAMYETQKSIRDYLFLRKVLGFLGAMASSPHADRSRFNSFFTEKKERDRFGESILLLLDRMADMKKPELLGLIWSACCQRSISYQDALRVSYMIDAVYWDDLSFLMQMRPGPQMEDEPRAESLHRAGLLSITGFDGGTFDRSSPEGLCFGVNRFGKILIDFGLSKMM